MYKPGIKTTEFWLTAVAQVIGLVSTVFVHVESPVGQVVVNVAGVLSTILATLGYQKARADVKMSSSAVP